MAFITFKNQGREIVLNTDRIISISFVEENKILINCTDQFSVQVDDSEAEIRKWLGVKKKGERTIGFGTVTP